MISQPVLNFADTVAAYIHCKYLFYNVCRFRVWQQVVAVVGVGYVPVRHFAVDALTLLCLCLFDSSDFL